MTLLLSVMSCSGKETIHTHTRFSENIHSGGISRLYLHLGAGAAAPDGIEGNFHLGCMFNENAGFIAGLYSLQRTSADLPSDFRPGLCIAGDCTPRDFLYSWSLGIQKPLESPYAMMRFTWEAGLSLVQSRTASFQRQYGSSFLASNYTVKYKDKYAPGAWARLKVDFPLLTFAGLQASVLTLINPYQTYAAVEFGINLGKVRNRF